MGRHIYENRTGDHVWKYWFARQPSEQCRIYTEIGMGSYRESTWGDILTLYCSLQTVSKLRQHVHDNYLMEWTLYLKIQLNPDVYSEDLLFSDKNNPFPIMCLFYADFIEKLLFKNKCNGKRLYFQGEL